jgi:hypothetical protein
MRFHVAALTAAVLGTGAARAGAQDHVRLMINAGQQVTSMSLKETQTFQQYFEEGSLMLERTIPKRLFYDGGVAVRVVGGLHVGASVSLFKDNGTGKATAQVPHPFFFNQLRTTTGDVPGVTRKETATHIQVSWTAPAAGGLEFTVFGGPTIFHIQQVLVTKLNLVLANEVFPFDTLNFPGVTTETVKGSMKGYNAGVDMTWRFAKHIGLAMLIRNSKGTKDFTPTGGRAVKIESGGLHAGGGLRVMF